MSESRDDLNGAGISPRERLQRIEDLLARVDGKLDAKVAVLEGRIAAVEQRQGEDRVRFIEQGATRSRMETRVDDLENGLGTLGRKLAYATGTLSAVIVVANLAVPFILSRL